MVQLSLNFTHMCGHTCAQTCFVCVKVYKLNCIFVARSFVVRTHAIKHSWHTRRAPLEQTCHERMLS